jgi:hypothetical protein
MAEKTNSWNFSYRGPRVKGIMRLSKELEERTLVYEDRYNADFYISRYRGVHDSKMALKINYRLSSVKEVFERLKSSEEGIEIMLSPNNVLDFNWKNTREVIRCVLDIEDQALRKGIF